MSVHGICFDNGMSGNCNEECENFLLGSCSEGSNMIDIMPIKMINDFYEEHENEFYAACIAVVQPNLDKRIFMKEELGYD